ncbi:MAG: 50S ribosomal protein L25 [Chloroflexota bacterium]|nr:50S ribosomal protein L25 [Chloroflexota bacterium]
MESIVLQVENRTVSGKKVKAMRREGATPANVFGHGIESQALKVDTAELEKVLSRAGTTRLVSLKSASTKASRRVLVKGIQRHPLTGELLHVDFHQVRMKDKVKVEVPIVFQGEAPASRRKDLVLWENLRSVEVECTPDEIPETIPIDITCLAEAGDVITVNDLLLGESIGILTHAEEVIAKVDMAKTATQMGVPAGESVTTEEVEAAEAPAEDTQQDEGSTQEDEGS